MSLGTFALVLTGATACGTTYTPAYSGRVSMMSNGLERGGALFRGGPFGGDVDQAVQGVPRAEDEMATYQHQQTVGTIFTYTGLAAFVVGSTMLEYANSRAVPDNNVAPGYAVGLAGLAFLVTGFILQISASGHLLDAVNIFNDTVAPWPGQTPSAAPSGRAPDLGPK
jgi:hypothetical protein